MPKKSEHPSNTDATAWQRLTASRTWVVFSLILLLVGVSFSGKWIWQSQQDHIRNLDRLKAEYQVTPPKPNWIENDIVDAVIRDGGLDEISLLDTDATKRIADAFELHPWVKQVDHVTKHADGLVEVILTYRQPAGFVKVPGGHFPVDADAQLLPVDVVVSAVQWYPRIEVDASLPPGTLINQSWDDPRVMGAAKIAAAFGTVWRDLNLYAISHETDSLSLNYPVPGLFLLYTRQNHRVIWGSAPGDEAKHEVSTENKVKRLVEYLRQTGTFEKLDPNIEIDLRPSDQILVSPRLATKPEKSNP